MMRPKKYVLMSVLVFFASLSVLLLFISNDADNEVKYSQEETPQQRRKIDPLLMPFQPEINRVNALALSDQDAAEKEGEALLKKLPKKYQRYFGIGFKAGMLPLDFYGKIIDQHGLPVTGAKMRYELGGKFLAPGKGAGLVETDEEGRFEIHSEGGSLVLYGIDHPKARLFYPPTKRSPTARGSDSPQEVSIRILGYQETSGGNNLLWTETSPEKPHVFTAWRVENYEAVQSGSAPGGIKSDGRVYTYDLTRKYKGRYNPYPMEGLKEGQLRVSCQRDPIKDRRDYKDWSVTISPIEGGIQATDDYYLSLAPESGYQASIKIEKNRSSKDYSPIANSQRFYFTANNGEIYGSLYINIDAHVKTNQCAIYISQYKINANGSRNLAIPPRKQY